MNIGEREVTSFLSHTWMWESAEGKSRTILKQKANLEVGERGREGEWLIVARSKGQVGKGEGEIVERLIELNSEDKVSDGLGRSEGIIDVVVEGQVGQSWKEIP